MVFAPQNYQGQSNIIQNPLLLFITCIWYHRTESR